uniref:Protein kinase domain-containing protein n=1 Tax=Compsopogon caeruleus TaxID=31354 RepID=A0A6T6D850_9RHOD|mmetsp:Transcript_9168/g.18603  ORF Transcript_9168/g.18603 Transcript_9168/m.18603 type:complete len:693 (+) Transcript_9168:1023-3101(+)|eukprot:CAMPEP_0184690370 /NCGR_PEP_ID=MMETSP0312-20130426/31191_1 /TAXON_ID=31354 /ORGANISM="Compsopogon coeruleus, Strain SAG 36.94" /LENGTH=692 /DNA_ID=CAMNT_0027147855 /DNA_START=961 /DNA_END=3039 /DNA_ORIENTATION=+
MVGRRRLRIRRPPSRISEGSSRKSGEVESRTGGGAERSSGWRRQGAHVFPREARKNGWVYIKYRGTLGRRLRYAEIARGCLSWKKTPRRRTLERLVLDSCQVAEGDDQELLLTTAGKTIILRLQNKSLRDEWIRCIQRASSDVMDHYFIRGKLIGRGSFGEVFLGTSIDTGEVVAIKTVDRRKISSAKELEFVRREIDIARLLYHRCIVRIHDVFDESDKVHFVMEYLGGGDLFDAIAEENHFSEKIAVDIIRDILEAVAYIHEKNIVHRDLKPENILCCSKTWPYNVKIADFGTARRSQECEVSSDRSMMSTFVGTPYYMAPEILAGREYSFPVDMWACGVMLFAMIAGRLPWNAVSESEYCRLSQREEVKFPSSEWEHISEDAKSMVRGLLQVDVSRRMTAREALCHRWLNTEQISVRRIPTDRSVLSMRRRRSLATGISDLAHKEEALNRLAALKQEEPFIEEAMEILRSSEVWGTKPISDQSDKNGLVLTAENFHAHSLRPTDFGLGSPVTQTALSDDGDEEGQESGYETRAGSENKDDCNRDREKRTIATVNAGSNCRDGIQDSHSVQEVYPENTEASTEMIQILNRLETIWRDCLPDVPREVPASPLMHRAPSDPAAVGARRSSSGPDDASQLSDTDSFNAWQVTPEVLEPGGVNLSNTGSRDNYEEAGEAGVFIPTAVTVFYECR